MPDFGFQAALGVRSLNQQAQAAGPPANSGFAAQLNQINLYRSRVNGPGYITGIVKVLDVPSARAVRLYDRVSGELLRTTQSASDGSYRFNNVQLSRKYMAVALDDAGNTVVYDAAVKDMIEAGV